MDNFIRFLHGSPAGDCLASLAGIRRMCLDSGKKAIIYQQLDMIGVGYQGAIHPYQNEIGDPICMSKTMFDNLKPLLMAQSYIEDFVEYNGQEVDINLNKARLETFTNQPLGSINRWLFHLCPQMACDLSEKWLEVPESEEDNSIVNRGTLLINHTFRYRNHFINYFFLKKYETHIVFMGLKDEYDFFCKKWQLNIPKFEGNFLDIAKAMSVCKMFAGNQSALFQIAEGLKIPRVLEISVAMPNCIPTGRYAYDYYSQLAAEFYFDKLMGSEKEVE
jgi:hypothetical protein